MSEVWETQGFRFVLQFFNPDASATDTRFQYKGRCAPTPPPPLYLSFLTNPLRLKLVTNKLVFQENSEKPLSEKFNLLLFTSSYQQVGQSWFCGWGHSSTETEGKGAGGGAAPGAGPGSKHQGGKSRLTGALCQVTAEGVCSRPTPVETGKGNGRVSAVPRLFQAAL